MESRIFWFRELEASFVTAKDADEIDALIKQLGINAPECTHSHLINVLKSGSHVFVATDGDRIIGTATLASTMLPAGKKFWIENVVVDAEYHRQGVATQLMDAAEAEAREQGATNINLTAPDYRLHAHWLYSQRGYVKIDSEQYRMTIERKK